MDDLTGRVSDFGAAIYRRIEEVVVIERDGWAAERAQRAADAINAVRAGTPLQPVIIWIKEAIAFTLPGTYLYVSRQLLSRGLTDGGLAFVIAHEMAHHDLGHFETSENLLVEAERDRWSTAAFTALLRHAITSLRYGPAQELEADRLAFELCVAAGYDGIAAAMDLFDLLEQVLLDYRQIDEVFGSDHAAPELSAVRTALAQISGNAAPSHPALVDRRDAILRLAVAETDSQDQSLAPTGLAGTNMVHACARCAVRFSPAPRCPRCLSSRVSDLADPRDRGKALSLVKTRARTPQLWSHRSAAGAIGALSVAVSAALLLAGEAVGEAVAAGAVCAILLTVAYVFLGAIVRDLWRAHGKWSLLARRLRRAAALEPVAVAPRLPGDAICVRGKIHVLRSIRSPLGGVTCAAWRVIGKGPGGRIDDAGLGEFSVLGEGSPALVSGEALVDLPAGSPQQVAIEGSVERFLRQRGALPKTGTATLAEAVLVEGDEVEVIGVPRREYVNDGLRGTVEALAFRGGMLIRRCPSP